jgi:hypothetical protein
VDDRAERIARNEDIFRKVNDRIEGVNEAFGMVTGTMSILCECGRIDCMEQIELTIDEYALVRSEPTHFAVRPGHEISDLEDVIARHNGYNLVAKTEREAAELAKELVDE